VITDQYKWILVWIKFSYWLV